MNNHWQAILENNFLRLEPLGEDDFDLLYDAASDPEIWAMHPNPNRWKLKDFSNFFTGAIQSKGAYKIIDKFSEKIIGSSRYYDLDEAKSEILIGYTFIAKDFWGKQYNAYLKSLMLAHAFEKVDKVILHVGAENIRSIKSLEKMGAPIIAHETVEYFGETPKLNAVFQFLKEDWKNYNF